MPRNNFNGVKSVLMIMDLQFGSTGKGLIAGYLAKKEKPDTVVTSWAANAGHTFIDSDNGRKYVHTMLANGIISPNLSNVVLGAGSLINIDSLISEIESAKDIINRGVNIWIHSNAAVILPKHVEEEGGGHMTAIGSTKKGCGAAAIDRIRRDVGSPCTIGSLPDDHPLIVKLVNYSREIVRDRDIRIIVGCNTEDVHNVYANSKVIMVEGAQGHSLSMYGQFYPFCTSRDVSINQMAADNCMPPELVAKATKIGTIRTFPIRVANRYNESGEKIGTSGGCYEDQHEVSFDLIDQPVELTTVTKLPRRIFTFSLKQMVEAVNANSIDVLFLNFANYLSDVIELVDMVTAIELDTDGVNVGYVGFGATDADVVDIAEHWGKKTNASDRIFNTKRTILKQIFNEVRIERGSDMFNSRNPVKAINQL